MPTFPATVHYSEKYEDDEYEYRHVCLTEDLYKKMPKGKLLSEVEWRCLGVQQSLGWEHFMIFAPEPWVLLFRRKLGTDPTTGKPMGWQ